MVQKLVDLRVLGRDGDGVEESLDGGTGRVSLSEVELWLKFAKD